jgi:hypothetical protein
VTARLRRHTDEEAYDLIGPPPGAAVRRWRHRTTTGPKRGTAVANDPESNAPAPARTPFLVSLTTQPSTPARLAATAPNHGDPDPGATWPTPSATTELRPAGRVG